jgi:hypothetical protein
MIFMGILSCGEREGGIAMDARAVGGLYRASIPSGCALERAWGGMPFQGAAPPGYLL